MQKMRHYDEDQDLFRDKYNGYLFMDVQKVWPYKNDTRNQIKEK